MGNFDISIMWFGQTDVRVFVCFDGFQLYAHRVRNIIEGIETAIQFVAKEGGKYGKADVMETTEVSTVSSEIVFDEKELSDAVKRGKDFDLEVFAGFEKDTFFVKNLTSETEYKVEFETADGKTKPTCECKDFYYRKRICKHIAAVLSDMFEEMV